MILRPPAFSGTFYNFDPEMLKKQIDSCFRHKIGPKTMKKQNLFAAIVPHAGYEYSGPVAAWAYSRMESANYIIIGTNHGGAGAPFAIMKEGIWKTPLGSVAINATMAEKLMKKCKLLEHDVIAHQSEHSIEVQLPFLQFRFGNDFNFVPISILNEYADDMLLDSCNLLGKSIANVLSRTKERWMIIAASDFSHYIPQTKAKHIDGEIIKSILKLDNKGMFALIADKQAGVCGYGAIAAAVAAAKEMGAKKSELLKYATSGEITGDLESVVGYASIVI